MKNANSNSPEKNKSNRSQAYSETARSEQKNQRANSQTPACNNGICQVTWKPYQA
ncbi:MAG: hypothetical protein K2X77_12710 [Candidatus Obscuribacterales bacterium]|nr:hypothetical protein [Candidatus Obscuribacterales bacterium]